MSFPASFRYENEADFIRRLLVPLLQRLGFNAVTNYHGTREHGKDLVFGETDRFGHHHYHGLQAKYVPSIAQKDAFGLIDDARQAFTMSFQHPTNGSTERISKFYLVNGGSISDNVRDLFFEALRPQYGANVRLIDGEELVSIERQASIAIEPEANKLTQLLRELTCNRALMIQSTELSQPGKNAFSISLRDDCSSEYIKYPCYEQQIDIAKITEYSNVIRRIQDKINLAGHPFVTQEHRDSIYGEMNALIRAVVTIGEELDNCIRSVLSGTGPLLDR